MRAPALAGLAVLALAGLALLSAAGGGPPVYDGICAPVNYTALGANPGPMSVTKVVHAGQADNVATPETVPQAQAIFPPGSFSLPAGTPVTVTVRAVLVPAATPSDGRIDGNVYAITAVDANGKAVSVASGQEVTIGLEIPPSGVAQPVMERFDGTRWNKLNTVQAGCGTSDLANTSSLGDFALVALGTPTGGGGGGSGGTPSGGPPWAPIIAAVAVILFGGSVLAVRRSRRR